MSSFSTRVDNCIFIILKNCFFDKKPVFLFEKNANNLISQRRKLAIFEQKPVFCPLGSLRVFLKTEYWPNLKSYLRLKIRRCSFLGLKVWSKHCFVCFHPRYLMLNTKDSKTTYLKSKGLKYAILFWEPQSSLFLLLDFYVKSSLVCSS